MWYQQMFAFAIYILMAQAKAGSDSRFNGGTSALLAVHQQQQQQQQQKQHQQHQQQQLQNNEQQQLQVNLNAWQPLTGNNNWLILQATAATSMQRQQEQQQHRLPVNYYAYNHRYNPRSTPSNDDTVVGASAAPANGNYKQVRPNLNDSPSYVLAISQTMRRGGDGGGSEIDDGELRRQLPPTGLKNIQEVNMNARQEVSDANDFMALTNAVDDVADGIEKPSDPVLDINNYLAPFEQAVLKVRNFCDTLRSLISVEGDVDTDDVEEEEQQHFPDAATTSISSRMDAKARTTISTTSKEVQGRYSRLTTTYQGRKLKKIKKKIQKLLLPLLIAYKLKFLTLIPVLIGGLTLLVGTTGLAGFFFALFTAVMSLKSSTGGHGSKAIILKKI